MLEDQHTLSRHRHTHYVFDPSSISANDIFRDATRQDGFRTAIAMPEWIIS
ncbi:hypothetical protein EM595_0665 [Duffyella gerundensis]|uniref:Uncharacterized protein n=1 Tax=Duffyella gerundensis TaxID=1619313 RepID=A0A0U5L1B6_9GAMM|nr:hypothetical protein EM595_0665 [Duffyella gerundensis]